MKSQALNRKENSGSGYAALIQSVLARFPERSRDIVLGRFGVKSRDKKTLEAIGKEYAITRERVRQIVDAALKNMRQTLSSLAAEQKVSALNEQIREWHGIGPIMAILDELVGDEATERGALTALLYSMPGVKVLKENKERFECVVTQDFSLADWKKTLAVVEEYLNEKQEVLPLTELYRSVAAKLPGRDWSEEKLAAYLAPSMIVGRNAFGYFGLASWSTVNPRGTRERAYLVLKMTGKPLHFRDIAMRIDAHGLARAGKKTHPQTVHNELIKDKRFVLVGRGTYALSSWGYKPGTVRQVLSDILKQGNKPMTREEILQAVMKVRQVKKSTVIINLNAFFTKVGKNIYTLGKS